MGLRLFNTLSQKVEDFRPLEEGQVRMYTCGPTVYHFVHIGNLRTFVFQDLLRRQILYSGYRLLHVMNITDVEDKIIARAQEEGLSIQEYTARYTRSFLDDMQTLRIQESDIMPRATEHIPEMTALIRRLEEKGLTYQRGGSTYFRISALPDYGKLSRIQLEDAPTPLGIDDADEYSKENPRDFVLWKAHRPGEASWETDLGAGRPGWHIECSAMSMKYLGESFDIHCGGIDLIFPHHENEIAQSEGATGKPFVRYWVHAAHLIVDGEKMAKSRGNFFTLRDLLDKGHSPAALRYLLASVHYRRQLNFTEKALEQAEAALQRVDDFLLRIQEVPDDRPGLPDLAVATGRARQDFEAAMSNDLNTSEALGALFKLVRQANRALEDKTVGGVDRDRIIELFSDANRIFDVFRIDLPELEDAAILERIRERDEARRSRDFAESDRIRDELALQGVVLEDTKEGTRWKKIR